MKQYGYSITYDRTKDETYEDYDEKLALQARSVALEAEDKKKDEEKKSNEGEGCIKAESRKLVSLLELLLLLLDKMESLILQMIKKIPLSRKFQFTIQEYYCC